MNSLLCLIALAATSTASPLESIRYYHTSVGIPLAEKIRKAELEIETTGGRITGGFPAPLGAHPYLIGLLNSLPSGFTSVCGASMLSNTKAVTAAHCWYDGWSQVLYMTLVFGTTTLFSGGIRVVSNNVEMHQNWNTQTYANDIAIITHSWVGYSNVIQPVALPSGALLSNDFVDVWAQASGYGMTGDGVEHAIRPDQVQSHVALRVISNDECRARFGSFVIDSTLCTSGAEGGNICSSDSGGPLSIYSGNQTVLIGVISYGSGWGCQTREPSGYARVTSFVPWIQARL